MGILYQEIQPSLFQCHLTSSGAIFFFVYFTALIHVYPQYIFTSKVGNPFIWNNDIEWKVSSVSTIDDYPFDRVYLPFSFPWLHKRTNFTWISPNGALQFHKEPPCCHLHDCWFAIRDQCNIDSYTDMIAGFLSDFNPKFYGTVSYSFLARNSSNPFIAFHYSNMSLFFRTNYTGPEIRDQSLRFDFVIYIFSSGKITIAYKNVLNPFAILGFSSNFTRVSLVGLRGPQGQNPIDFYKNEWNTTANGTYVPHQLVKPNTKLTFWPITKDVCSIGWIRLENIWMFYFTFGFFGSSSSHLFRSHVEAVAHPTNISLAIPLTVLYDENSGLMKIPFTSSFWSHSVFDSDNHSSGFLSFTFDGENLPIDRLFYTKPLSSSVISMPEKKSNVIHEMACKQCHKVIPFYCLDACHFNPCDKSATCIKKLPAVTNSRDGRTCICKNGFIGNGEPNHCFRVPPSRSNLQPTPSPTIYISNHSHGVGLFGLGWGVTIAIIVLLFLFLIFSISRIINICQQQRQRRTVVQMSTVSESSVSDTENESFLSLQLKTSIKNGSSLVET